MPVAVSRVYTYVRNNRRRRLNAYLGENDRGSNRHQVIQLDQNVILSLISIGTVHKHLSDTSNSELIVLEFDFRSIRTESVSILSNTFGKCCREQENLLQTWQRAKRG